MPHEISRILRAFAGSAWFMEPRKADEIVAVLELRHRNGVRAGPYRDEPAPQSTPSQTVGSVCVVRLYGPIMPRAEAIEDISQRAALMTDFMKVFAVAEADPSVRTIVLDIDSPGGRVDLVPEAAEMVAKCSKRTVAIANTWACSAAYWIACQADELVVTPSGEVGSIGVYCLHEDVSDWLKAEGVRLSYIYEGSRKVEGNPFEPLGAEARKHLQDSVRGSYEMFVAAVAKGRKVPISTVTADPETTSRHFGGGRSYLAKKAVQLGLADRVESFDNLMARLTVPTAPAPRTALASTPGIVPVATDKSLPTEAQTTPIQASWSRAIAKANRERGF